MNTHFSLEDHQYMSRAIKLAKRAWYTTSPNPRVGCVIVNEGVIVGEGWHVKAGQRHAEVNAIAQAGNKTHGATAYVTLEPCSHFGRTPPCAQGLINAGVSRVVAAMVDPNPQVSGRGLRMLQDAGVEVSSGLLEQDAMALNPGFLTLMQHKRPYVRSKLAASLDGKTAMASGESQWITGPAARQDVQRYRAQSCAIISGADSVITDNARMTVRWSELGELKNDYAESDIRQPIRVIIDSKNRLTPDLALFSESSPIIIMTAKVENIHQWPHFVQHIEIPCCPESQQLLLPKVLAALAEQGLNDVLIESGRRLTGAFIEQGLVDELILYQAPKLLGDSAQGLVAFKDVAQLSQAKQLKIKDITMVGKDIRTIAQIIN